MKTMTERDRAKKDVEDPEETLRRKFRAKCLFRALGRLAMANAYWLIEASDHYEGLEDVKRRVEQAKRGKTRRKRLLSIDHVKKKLAAVTYFKYYGPGRTIVRQHHEAHALYFIVTGDVVVSQLVFDELLQRHVSVDVGTMHPGDMFGEVSLLHNIPRTATVTTAGHCEFLALKKEDFKHVLQASIQKEWDQVRLAMSSFTYFHSLDEVAFREGCIVARMKSYDVNEILLGDGLGVPNFVYFILSGRCQMIESLQVIVTTRLGRQYYTLYDPFITEKSQQDLSYKYLAALKALEKESSVSDTATDNKRTDTASGSGQIKLSASKTGRSLLEDTGREASLSNGSKQEKPTSSLRTESAPMSKMGSRRNVSESKDFLAPIQQEQWRDSQRLSLTPSQMPGEFKENIQTYFMQVCQLNPGSSFGFGENMRDRRIVTLTKVECLLLPKVWLLQRNSANIWTRIQHYLEMKIPTKKQLFNEFVSSRRWAEYRDRVVADVVARSSTVNATSVHDVPFSIRTEEMLDL